MAALLLFISYIEVLPKIVLGKGGHNHWTIPLRLQTLQIHNSILLSVKSFQHDLEQD